jgi:hypothetical protein
MLRVAINRGILLLMLELGACSTSIKYTQWRESDQVQSTALRFRLPDSTITLAIPSSSTSAQSAPASSGPAAAKPAAPCPDDVTSDTWWQCFKQVIAQAAPAASTVTPSAIWVATPDDAGHLYLTTTAISGTPIQGQDAVYSVITVKFTSNVGTAVAGGGSGAVAGFGIGGPYGAAAGFILGGIGAVAIPAPGRFPAPPPPPPTLTDYICAYQAGTDQVDLSNAATTPAIQKPSIAYPIVVKVADARPLAPKSELTAVDSPRTVPAACWHTLPNATLVGLPKPVSSSTSTTPRAAQAGDGWLYRIIATETDDPTAQPAGTIKTADYFSGNDARQDFPYPACRKVTMQVTWWQELANAITQASPAPKVMTFDIVVADPNYVSLAYVKKGGAINFKADCGANVSMDPDTSGAAVLNAVVTATENIYKAEQTWAGSQKK